VASAGGAKGGKAGQEIVFHKPANAMQDPVQAIVEKPPTRVTMKSQTSAEIIVLNSKKCNADEKPDSVRMKNRIK
jgi:hypothetical protein